MMEDAKYRNKHMTLELGVLIVYVETNLVWKGRTLNIEIILVWPDLKCGCGLEESH